MPFLQEREVHVNIRPPRSAITTGSGSPQGGRVAPFTARQPRRWTSHIDDVTPLPRYLHIVVNGEI